MQDQIQDVGNSRFTVDGAELAAGLLLREVDLEIDVTSRDTASNSAGTRLELTRAADGVLLASAVVLRAERASALRSLGIAPNTLRSSAVLQQLVVLEGGKASLLAVLYAASRRARMLDRANLLLQTSAGAEAVELLRFEPCSQQLGSLYIQRVDMAAHYADQQLSALGQPVHARLRAQEVAETIRRWLSNGRQWGLFRAVHARTLTRRQYVYALSNIYQFVRHTTRILARCIAYSNSTEMRSHFIHHLNGEVNHELIIERDLKNLGEDVGYVVDHMAPNGPTQEFMAIQESLIGYYEDPILLMASPMAAEGVTAHLDQAFVDGLHECMRAWGVPVPEKASKFFVSHMNTDGGEDGHWEMTVTFLAKCLTDETKHQFFLRSMRNSMRGTQRLYDSFVDDIPNFAGEHAQGDKSEQVSEIRA